MKRFFIDIALKKTKSYFYFRNIKKKEVKKFKIQQSILDKITTKQNFFLILLNFQLIS
jgi:hypothetical protein